MKETYSLQGTGTRPAALLLKLLAIACFLFALFIALRYAGQVLFDLHSFRQTQTALTSYWFVHDGFRLDYETPVVGYPWSVPFEFPIYQFLVAVVVKLTGARLDVVGRVLSFVFLIGCLFPARAVIRRLKLPNAVFYAFVALLFSSPIYVYWGRTFMVETAALFFAVSALPFFIDLLTSTRLRPIAWFTLFSTLAMLQKATTELPLLILLAAVYALHALRAGESWRTAFKPRILATAMVCFAIPVFAGTLWTIHTDHVKELNSIGTQLTSSALTEWNWGTLAQRTSRDFFVEVIWRRLFEKNLAGLLGLFAFFSALVLLPRTRRDEKLLVAFCLCAGLLPPLMFANLHHEHFYYPTANVIFPLFGLAVVAGGYAVEGARNAWMALIGVAIAVTSNLVAFHEHYFAIASTRFDSFNSRDIAIGRILKREIPETQSFAAYGFDWSSTVAWFAGRKALTVPPWFRQYDEAVQHPEKFVGDAPLGAVAGCLVDADPYFLPMLRSGFAKGWNFASTHGCYIGMPERPLPKLDIPPRRNEACEGNIDSASALLDPKTKKPLDHISHIWGWTTVSGAEGKSGGDVYVTLTDASGATTIRRALRVPRADISAQFHRKKLDDAGFSLIMDASKLDGRYEVGMIREANGQMESCQWRKDLLIE